MYIPIESHLPERGSFVAHARLAASDRDFCQILSVLATERKPIWGWKPYPMRYPSEVYSRYIPRIYHVYTWTFVYTWYIHGPLYIHGIYHVHTKDMWVKILFLCISGSFNEVNHPMLEGNWMYKGLYTLWISFDSMIPAVLKPWTVASLGKNDRACFDYSPL